jgi:hypothetical protein
VSRVSRVSRISRVSRSDLPLTSSTRESGRIPRMISVIEDCYKSVLRVSEECQKSVIKVL